MEAKHKNALIGALLAVVFIMAVGYAAFAQQLTINGSADITSKWDVHMDSEGAEYVPTSTMGTTPTGSVNVADGGLTADFTANFTSPGDKITYTIPIVNAGTLNARLSNITLSSDTPGMDIQGLVATSEDGNIKYTVTSPGTGTLNANNGRATITIVAEFVDKAEGQENAQNVTANLTVTMTYVQA